MRILRGNNTLAVGALAAALAVVPFSALGAAQQSSPELLFEQNRSWKLPDTPADMVQSVDGQFVFILTDNHKLLIYEANGKLKGSVDVSPGITAIDSDARGENILLIDKENNTFQSFSIDFVVDVDISGSPFKGKADAPVTMVIFSDFE
jgi:hypothetical protein